MNEYANNLQARFDNILNDTQNVQYQKPIDYFTNEFSIEIGVCWLIVGILIGCVICFYAFYCSDFTSKDKTDKD